jgi:hypothetical protein
MTEHMQTNGDHDSTAQLQTLIHQTLSTHAAVFTLHVRILYFDASATRENGCIYNSDVQYARSAGQNICTAMLAMDGQENTLMVLGYGTILN